MKILILALTAFFSAHSQAAVWTATQQWSPSTEAQYQDWVRTSWTKNVFDNPGPLQGVVLDCADAVYSMRLLYAYENKLPFAVKDPSSNRVISNEMGRFNSVGDADKRFRAFALYLYDLLGTETLNEDSYPLAMNRSAIHAGVFLKTEKASHHSWTVKDLDRAGVPYLLFASRPARTTLLDRHYYPTAGFLWGRQDASGNQISSALQTPGDVKMGAGFRMYRYQQDLLKPEWQVPGYSTDQYQMNMISWAHTVQRALQISAETSDQLVSRLVGEACKEASDRVSVVQAAIRAQSSNCFNASQYDDYSTPSKDSRSVGVFRELVQAYKSASDLSSQTRARAEAIVSGNDHGAYCALKISSSEHLTLGQAVGLALRGKWSSNPNDTLRARWGLDRSPSSRAASCPTY